DATFTGNGGINLNNAVLTSPAAARLTSDNNLTGTGTLGNNVTQVTSSGIITAQGGTIFINPGDAVGTNDFVNSGTIQATGSSTITLSGANGGSFINTGTILAGANGTILLTQGADITGGT